MKLASVKLAFPPSPSEDVVAYRIRVLPHDADAEAMAADGSLYQLPFAEIDPNADEDGNVRTNLVGLEVMPTTSGLVDIAVTAVDEYNNESGPMVVDDAMLDFEPPLAPGAGWLEH